MVSSRSSSFSSLAKVCLLVWLCILLSLAARSGLGLGHVEVDAHGMGRVHCNQDLSLESMNRRLRRELAAVLNRERAASGMVLAAALVRAPVLANQPCIRSVAACSLRSAPLSEPRPDAGR